MRKPKRKKCPADELFTAFLFKALNREGLRCNTKLIDGSAAGRMDIWMAKGLGIRHRPDQTTDTQAWWDDRHPTWKWIGGVGYAISISELVAVRYRDRPPPRPKRDAWTGYGKHRKCVRVPDLNANAMEAAVDRAFRRAKIRCKKEHPYDRGGKVTSVIYCVGDEAFLRVRKDNTLEWDTKTTNIIYAVRQANTAFERNRARQKRKTAD